MQFLDDLMSWELHEVGVLVASLLVLSLALLLPLCLFFVTSFLDLLLLGLLLLLHRILGPPW